MNFEMLTHSGENITIPLLEPHRLWKHPKFRQDWDVVLLVTGWNSNINHTNDALDAIYSAYREREVNFVVGIHPFAFSEKFEMNLNDIFASLAS